MQHLGWSKEWIGNSREWFLIRILLRLQAMCQRKIEKGVLRISRNNSEVQWKRRRQEKMNLGTRSNQKGIIVQQVCFPKVSLRIGRWRQQVLRSSSKVLLQIITEEVLVVLLLLEVLSKSLLCSSSRIQVSKGARAKPKWWMDMWKQVGILARIILSSRRGCLISNYILQTFFIAQMIDRLDESYYNRLSGVITKWLFVNLILVLWAEL